MYGQGYFLDRRLFDRSHRAGPSQHLRVEDRWQRWVLGGDRTPCVATYWDSISFGCKPGSVAEQLPNTIVSSNRMAVLLTEPQQFDIWL